MNATVTGGVELMYSEMSRLLSQVSAGSPKIRYACLRVLAELGKYLPDTCNYPKSPLSHTACFGGLLASAASYRYRAAKLRAQPK